MSIPKVVGIETEYGILLTGTEASDPFYASHLLLSAYGQVGKAAVPCRSLHSLTQEADADLHRARAIRVEYSAPGRGDEGFSAEAESEPHIRLVVSREHPASAQSALPYDETDLMLANGARYYIDHAHPEYSTPECLSPRMLVAADKAGERILAACQHRVNTTGVLLPEQQLRVYKNNSDYKNNSYGCHENYLLSAQCFLDLQYRKVHQVFRYILPFLATRLLVCGSGKVGAEHGTDPAGFQLSQRADFFASLLGLQTTFNRPLFNTRDEPHADGQRFRRLHVIPGDANMAEFSTYLKIGTTQLLFQMIEDHFIKDDLTLSQPVQAIHTISRDFTFARLLHLEDGRQMTALNIQEYYLDLAYRYIEERGGSDEQRSVLEAWDEVLGALPADWEQLATRLDWAIKRRLMERYLRTQGTHWGEVAAWQAIIEEPENAAARRLAQQAQLPWDDYERQRDLYFALRRLDLQYHDIRWDPEQGEVGLFYHLQQRGAVKRVVTDDEIGRLTVSPPPETRAWLRGQCIDRFARLITAADWSTLSFQPGAFAPRRAKQIALQLFDPLMGTEAAMGSIWPQLHHPSAVVAHCLSAFGQPEEEREQERE